MVLSCIYIWRYGAWRNHHENCVPCLMYIMQLDIIRNKCWWNICSFPHSLQHFDRSSRSIRSVVFHSFFTLLFSFICYILAFFLTLSCSLCRMWVCIETCLVYTRFFSLCRIVARRYALVYYTANIFRWLFAKSERSSLPHARNYFRIHLSQCILNEWK